jgi:hypothetical protein
MENPFITQENAPKRSTVLTVFLVLTFIGSGFNFIGNAYTSLAFENVLEMIDDLVYDDSMAAFAAFFEQAAKVMEKGGVLYYGILTLLALVSLTGAFLIWKLNKFGFHLYASAQILMLFIPMVFGMIKYPGLFATALTALFIWVYARELKVFNK